MSGSSRVGCMVGKVALVTGAGAGIGRAAAERLADEGARVAVTDIDAAAAEATAAAIRGRGEGALALSLDVTDEGAWASVFDRVVADLGGVDALINNAGVSAASPIVETSLADFRRVMGVNLDGVFLGTRQAMRVMKSAGRGGSIVNVASASGKKASAGAASYCASKAAVVMLTKVAALEGAGFGVRVNAVLPAGVETSMWESMPFFEALVREHGGAREAYAVLAQGTPLKRFAAPREVASVIAMLASDEASYVTGAELVVDGGYTA